MSTDRGTNQDNTTNSNTVHNSNNNSDMPSFEKSNIINNTNINKDSNQNSNPTSKPQRTSADAVKSPTEKARIYLRSKIWGKRTLSSPELVIQRIFKPELLNKEAIGTRNRNLSMRDRILVKWMQTVHMLLPLGGGSEGNDVTVYSEGGQAMVAMWDAIDNAKERILMEAYILKLDVIGESIESQVNLRKFHVKTLNSIKSNVICDIYVTVYFLFHSTY
jgi:phosphatidylserine/phosphatidylglycerophosphate/cardiolipin synthase-like enzyme